MRSRSSLHGIRRGRGHNRQILSGLAAVLALLAGCGGGKGSGGTDGNVGWPAWGNVPENTHFATLKQVDRGNVRRLRLAWTRPGDPGQTAWETFPIVVGRTMYYDTGVGRVFAVDAATGRLRWTYAPRVDFLAGPGVELSEPVSRGVAYGAGRIYLTTADDRLIALDARTGEVRWRARVADPARGDTMNSPGAFWDGELIVGGPAGAAGRRGFVAAYDAATGRRLWRTFMVPPRRRPGRAAAASYAGGDVWMPPVVDPRAGTVYVSTGNPTPGLTAVRRPGCAPLADAVVALDAKTGRIEWSHTQVCHDSWDYDTVQAPTVLDLPRGGGARRAVGAASKAGFWSTLDAATGRLLARSPYITGYSRPHRRPTRRGTVVCPGIYGGIEYGPAAWSAARESLFLAGNRMCMRYSTATRPRSTAGEGGLGGTAEQVGEATGVLAALDPATGRVRWRVPLPRPANGGALATAGGLVFLGDDDGYLYAFDDRGGRLLWRHDLGRRVGAAPIAYEVDGVEYVAIAAGGSQVEARGTAPDAPARLFVFRLAHPRRTRAGGG